MDGWDVLVSSEFEAWHQSLSESEQRSLDVSILVLSSEGPRLGRPHVDSVQGSRHSNMKELRTQHKGRPVRTFFAFDPNRAAILLIGGDKTGDNRFYQRLIPVADRILDRHIEQVREVTDGD